jgi:predicted dehydrogenase
MRAVPLPNICAMKECPAQRSSCSSAVVGGSCVSIGAGSTIHLSRDYATLLRRLLEDGYLFANPLSSFMDSSTLLPLRIGIVGAGGIVKQRHMPGLRALPGIQITAVANASLSSAEAFCRDFAPEAKPTARWEDVVDNEEVDIVWVGAHPYMHRDATCFGLDCGKHVFTQARMAASLEEAERMWEASLRFPDLVTGICPAPQGMKHGGMMKQLLTEGAIGTPLHAMLHSFTAAWLDASQPVHWRQRMEISGIQILTLGIYIEVLQRWLGHIVEVEARGSVVIPERQGMRVDVPDFVNVLARFRSGLEATLMFSGVASHAPTDKLWIFGSEGALCYDFNTDEITLGKAGAKLEVMPVPTEMQRAWTVERDFIQAVRDPTAPRPKPDFTEGVCYMRVVDGVWQALESCAAVKCA